MKSSTEIKNIAKALVAAQKQMTGAVKDSKNPFFSSDYANLESVIDAVKKPLNDNGISFIQPCDTYDGESVVVKSVLIHESGEWISSEMTLPKASDMQKLGSAVTYARRYTLASVCGLPQVDDDAESTMDRKHKNQIDERTDLKQVKEVRPNVPTIGVKKSNGVKPQHVGEL